MYSYLSAVLLILWISFTNSKSTLLGIDTSSSSSSATYLPMIEKLKVQYEELKLSLDSQLHTLSSTIINSKNEASKSNEASLISSIEFQNFNKSISLLHSELLSLQNQYTYFNQTYSLSLFDLSSNFSSALVVSNSILAKAIGEVNSTHNTYKSILYENLDLQLSNITLWLENADKNNQQNMNQIEMNINTFNDTFHHISMNQTNQLSIHLFESMNYLHHNLTDQLINISEHHSNQYILLNTTLQDKILQLNIQQEENKFNQLEIETLANKLLYMNDTLYHLKEFQNQIWLILKPNITSMISDYYQEFAYHNMSDNLNHEINQLNHSVFQTLHNISTQWDSSLLIIQDTMNLMNSTLAMKINQWTDGIDDISNKIESIHADYNHTLNRLNLTLTNDRIHHEEVYNHTNNTLSFLIHTLSTNLTSLDNQFTHNISFLNSSWNLQYQALNHVLEGSLLNLSVAMNNQYSDASKEQSLIQSSIHLLNESYSHDLNQLKHTIHNENQLQSEHLFNKCNHTMIDYTDRQLETLNHSLSYTIHNTTDIILSNLNQLKLSIDTNDQYTKQSMNESKKEQIVTNDYFNTTLIQFNKSLNIDVEKIHHSINLMNESLSNYIDIINQTLSIESSINQQNNNHSIHVLSTITLPHSLHELSNHFNTSLNTLNSTLVQYIDDSIEHSMDNVSHTLFNVNQSLQESITILNTTLFNTLNVINTNHSNQIFEIQLYTYNNITSLHDEFKTYQKENQLLQDQNHQQILQHMNETYLIFNQSMTVIEKNISNSLFNHTQTLIQSSIDIDNLQNITQKFQNDIDTIQLITLPLIEQSIIQLYHNISSDTKNELKIALDHFYQIQHDIELFVSTNYTHMYQHILQLIDTSNNTTNLLMIDIMPRLAVYDSQLQSLFNQSFYNFQSLSTNLNNQILNTNQQLLTISTSIADNYHHQQQNMNNSIDIFNNKMNTIQNHITTSIDPSIQSIFNRINESDKIFEKYKFQSETLFAVYSNVTQESKNDNFLKIQEIGKLQNQLKEDFLETKVNFQSFQIYTNQSLNYIFNQLIQLQQQYQTQLLLQSQQFNITNENQRNLMQSSHSLNNATIATNSAQIQTELKYVTQKMDKLEQSHTNILEALPLEINQKTDQLIQYKLIPYLTKDSEIIHSLNHQLISIQAKIKQQDDKIHSLELELMSLHKDCVTSTSLDSFRKEFQALQSSFIAHSGKVLEVVTASLHK